MDYKSRVLLCLIGFCICVIGDCRPESPSSYSSQSVTAATTVLKQGRRVKSRSIDQMVFPESGEVDLLFDGNDPARETTARTVVKGAVRRVNIAFPDTTQSQDLDSDEPECANGQPFCTEDSSYPKSTIEDLLQRVGSHLNDLLQSDPPEEENLSNRDNGFGEEKMCDYESRMEYPTRALSRDDKWLPIVNHANYTQGIRIETCRNIDRPCKFSAFFPHNYRTACVQKYHFKKLLALDEGGQLRIESFSIPSYCECSIIIMS